ncbi:MAG: hypothetical protein WC915_06285 [archaeon]|jgi:hypothetical protein
MSTNHGSLKKGPINKSNKVIPYLRLVKMHKKSSHELLGLELRKLSVNELTKAIEDLRSHGNVRGDILDVHAHEELLQLLTGAKFIKEAELRKAQKNKK